MNLNKEYFAQAIDLWKEWNSKINIVSRRDIDNLYEHHILHSLAIAEYLERRSRSFPSGSSVLDLGTGGGFPGLPLAMIMPEVQFTLCDSIAKKVKVAQAISDSLGLKNVTCVNARAESLPQCFDYVVSRAVTSLNNFYPWVKGKFRHSILYLKGGDVDSEILELCRESGLKRENFSVWPIVEWLNDDYFSEKFVIEIGKDYLCAPKLD